ncbi:SLAP domain-containing protein [Lactobacillus sp. ESL0785]|uniref:SLAP domain-containing protein n=1 Tax=Lactobacillus sp. ESL0785 TaxID=2983232 RepID=UPI0023F959B8|nr:SLAP domain-containing protein [Lactobacillus sp. ESL0785]WEV70758.1 SLAP domain-containing protein [Lactobacillus sp. ESL0785]
MKKNYRIVSAAAAALLAVAPVAASAVATVSAATNQAPSTPTNAPANAGIPITNGSVTNNGKASEVTVKVNVTNAAALKDGDAAAAVVASLETQLGTGVTGVTASVTGTVNPSTNQVDMAYIYESDDKGNIADGAKPVAKLEAGKTYVAVAQNVVLNGVGATTKYIFNGDKGSDGNGVYGHDLKAKNIASDPFTVPDASKQGNPYFYGNNEKQAVTSGQVSLTQSANTVADLAAKINAAYVAKVDDSSTNAASVSIKGIENSIKSALKDANVKVDDKGNFVAPANDFVVKVNAIATNGKTATLPVTVHTIASSNKDYPQIGLIGDKDKDGNQIYKAGDDTVEISSTYDFNSTTGAGFNYLPVNTPLTDTIIKNIQAAFTTKINDGTNVAIATTVDTSKVNTKVAGKYPVVVSATNPAGLTSKITFMLAVGAKDAKYSTVQYETGMSIPVYTINGNTVTAENGVSIADGTQVAYYGAPVTIDGKSYTRINKKDGNEFIETKYIDGSYKPQNKVTKTVMHAAKVYDKTGKSASANVAAYTDVTVYGDKIKLDNGKEAYMIGDNKYVLVGNIDGTSRTLTHNAYVYKTSKKRVGHTKYLKGQTVTTYGSSYTFKNGQAYYRIGKKQYIKVANF